MLHGKNMLQLIFHFTFFSLCFKFISTSMHHHTPKQQKSIKVTKIKINYKIYVRRHSKTFALRLSVTTISPSRGFI